MNTESIEGIVYALLGDLHPTPQDLISLLVEHAHSVKRLGHVEADSKPHRLGSFSSCPASGLLLSDYPSCAPRPA